MNKHKIYKILYYICLVLTAIPFIITARIELTIGTTINNILGIINLLLIIIFTIKLIKYKLKNINILFPIIYLLLLIFIILLSAIVNTKLIIPYLFFNYYFNFILFNYVLLNIYSIISLTKKN